MEFKYHGDFHLIGARDRETRKVTSLYNRRYQFMITRYVTDEEGRFVPDGEPEPVGSPVSWTEKRRLEKLRRSLLRTYGDTEENPYEILRQQLRERSNGMH